MATLERVIFIAGANHSGTTLMGCALGAGPDPFEHFHVGECYVWFRPEPKTSRRDSPFWQGINHSVDPSTAYHALAEASGSRTLIDSSKNIGWLRTQAAACREMGVPLHVVVPYRDMRQLYRSVVKRVGDDAKAIRDRLTYYGKLAEHLDEIAPDSVTMVDTTEFCATPAKQLRALCKAVEIPYFRGKEKYWRFEHHHLRGARRQRRQVIGVDPGGYELPGLLSAAEQAEAEAYLADQGIVGASEIFAELPLIEDQHINVRRFAS